MSGRIRTVKPEWLEDEVMASASSDARVLSIALILMADDYGNGRCHHVTMASRVFPVSGNSLESLQNSSARFLAALSELEAMRFVGLYGDDRQHYFAIRNWAKHQKVNHPGKPLVPSPPESIWNVSRDSQETLKSDSGGSLETLLPDRRPTTNDRERTNEAAEDFPSPEPPKPKREDPLMAQLTGTQPGQLPEVREIHRVWRETFGKHAASIGNLNGEFAKMLRDAARDYGLADCLAVIRYAPNDGMVSGKDDEKGKPHDDLFYILNNKRTFDRLLVAAKAESAPKPRKKSIQEQIDDLKNLPSGAPRC